MAAVGVHGALPVRHAAQHGEADVEDRHAED